MAKHILVNQVSVHGAVYRAARELDDGAHDVAAVRAAGGKLVPLPNARAELLAAKVRDQQAKGLRGTELDDLSHLLSEHEAVGGVHASAHGQHVGSFARIHFSGGVGLRELPDGSLDVHVHEEPLVPIQVQGGRTSANLVAVRSPDDGRVMADPKAEGANYFGSWAMGPDAPGDSSGAWSYGTVGGGNRNAAPGAYSTVPGGLDCTTMGRGAFASGVRCEASAEGASARGVEARAWLPGQDSMAACERVQRVAVPLNGSLPGKVRGEHVELLAAGHACVLRDGRTYALRVTVAASLQVGKLRRMFARVEEVLVSVQGGHTGIVHLPGARGGGHGDAVSIDVGTADDPPRLVVVATATAAVPVRAELGAEVSGVEVASLA